MPSSSSSAMQQTQQNVFMPITHVPAQSLTSPQSIGSPELSIIEQPKQGMRFRYPTEKGNHGCLTGRTPKSFPAVRLENYKSSDDVYVKASLYTADDEDPRLHVHTFKGQNCENGTCTVVLDREHMVAIFENLKIEYCQKKVAESNILQRYMQNNDSNENPTVLKQKAKEEVKKLNLSCVRIYFEAFTSYSHVIATTFSDQIFHQNDPKCNSLRIVRIDKTTSPMKGGEEVFLLCSKVDKNDIEVKFYEYNDNDQIIWEGNGQFNKLADVHYQYAIVFKTPPYTIDENLKCTSKKVMVQLYRPSGGQTSDPIPFWYMHEDEDEQEISRKRKKLSHFQGPIESMGEFSGASNPSSVECSPQESRPPILPAAYSFPGHYSTSPSTSFESDESLDKELTDAIISIYRNMNMSNDAQININTDISMNYENSSVSNELTPMLPILAPECDPMLSSTMPQTNQHLEGYNTIYDTEFWEVQSGPMLSDLATDSVPKSEKTSERSNVDKLHKEFVNLNLSREGKCTPQIINKEMLMSKKAFIKIIQQYRTMTNEDGDNLLHLAVLSKNNLRLLTIFIDALADHLPDLLNKQNNLKQTPLHLAVIVKCAQTVGILLDHDADLSVVDKKGNTPLHLAAKYKTLNCLKKITDKMAWFKCTLNDIVNFDGYTALHLSIMNQSEECAKLLVDAGANIWTKDKKSGRTALRMAVLHLPTVVKMLLTGRPCCATTCHNNLDIEDYQGNTALHLACINQLPEVAQLLVDIGATPLLKNTNNDDDEIAYSISNNNKIINDNVMQGVPSTTSTTDIIPKCNSKLLNPQPCLSQTDSGYISNNEISLGIVDDATVAKLEKLLNPPNSTWKLLANFSGVDEELIQNIAKLEKNSPTKAILRLFMQERRTTEELLATLDFAGLKEAYDIVKTYCDTQ